MYSQFNLQTVRTQVQFSPSLVFSLLVHHPSWYKVEHFQRVLAGLGQTQIALPTQLTSHFGFQHKFAMCLASLGESGVLFFGGGPYMM
ncbi:hypothetical protein MKX03_013593, partial [Papaver bracteatum]